MTLTVARTADAGAPQVGITIDGLSGATPCTVLVSVSWDGGATWQPVRGGSLSGVLSAVYIRDYVCPLNVPAVYRAVVTGGTAATWTTTITVASPVGWVQDPLVPRGAVSFAPARRDGSLVVMPGSFATITYDQPADIATPIGSSQPVASIAQRQAPSKVPLVLAGLVSAHAQQLAALRALCKSSGQLVVRGLPVGVPLDPVVHARATVSESYGPRMTAITLTLDQVAPVSLRVQVPWWTYEQVAALVATQVGPTATYAQVAAAMPAGKTYLQWLAEPGVAS